MLLTCGGSPLGFDPAANPVVALLEWPGSYPAMERHLSRTAALLAEHGVDAVPCHLGQVEYRPDGVHVAGRRVDLVHRWFVINDVVTAEDAALLAPLSRAADRCLVHLFTPLENEVYGSRAALALLSDTRDRSLFDRAEREVIDALLPWTRLVRDERTEVAGERVELLRYAAAHRDELVLKASSSHSGLDVLAGWETPAEAWPTPSVPRWTARTSFSAGSGPCRRSSPSRRGRHRTDGAHLGASSWRAEATAGAYLRGTADLDSGVISSGKGGRLGTAFLVDDSRPPAP